MMKIKVPKHADELACGMIAADNMYDNLGILLCRGGTEITEAMLADLRHAGVDEVSVLEETVLNDAESDPAPAGDESVSDNFAEMDAEVDRSLSPIMHYEEVKRIAEVIKKVNRGSVI